MKSSDTIDLLAAATAKFQAELEPAVKDATNPAFRSHYATLASIREAIRVPLAKNDLAVWQEATLVENSVGVTTRLVHKSGQWAEFGPVVMPVDKHNAHGVMSAISYGRRASLGAALGVVTEDDDDGNAAAQTSTVPSQAQAKPQAAPNTNTAPAPPQAPAQAIQTQTFTAAVTDVQEASGAKDGKPWKKFGLTFDNGMTAGTFDAKIGAAANVVVGTGKKCRVEVKTAKNPKYFDVLVFAVVGEDDALGF